MNLEHMQKQQARSLEIAERIAYGIPLDGLEQIKGVDAVPDIEYEMKCRICKGEGFVFDNHERSTVAAERCPRCNGIGLE